ncbi:MAG: hypothetical protein Fur0020_13350 [Thermodesulfovibrionia bacterium]
MVKTIELDKIYSAIIDVAKERNAKLALIFGSLARGDYSKKSDLDVIFIEDTEVGFIDRISDYLKALRDKDVLKQFDIDVLIYTPREFADMRESGNRFILKVLREGKVLYGG